MRRVVTLVAMALAFVGLSSSVALAQWAAAGSTTMKTGGLTATLSAPGQPTATVVSTGVDLTWSAATVSGATSAGVGYYVQRVVAGTAAPVWTTATSVCGSDASPITLRACNDANVVAGTYLYRVVSRLGASWNEPSTPVSMTRNALVTDTAGPVVTGTIPSSTSTVTYTRGRSGTWTSSAGEKISFTVADATGVGTVQMTVQQGTSTNGFLTSAGNFNGSSTGRLTPALTAGTYSLSVPDNKLQDGSTYTVTIYATDTASPANSSTTTYVFKTA